MYNFQLLCPVIKQCSINMGVSLAYPDLDGGILVAMWTFLFLLQDMVLIVDHFD